MNHKETNYSQTHNYLNNYETALILVMSIYYYGWITIIHGMYLNTFQTRNWHYLVPSQISLLYHNLFLFSKHFYLNKIITK